MERKENGLLNDIGGAYKGGRGGVEVEVGEEGVELRWRPGRT